MSCVGGASACELTLRRRSEGQNCEYLAKKKVAPCLPIRVKTIHLSIPKHTMKICIIAAIFVCGSSVRAETGGIRSVESGGDEKGSSVSLNYRMLNYYT